MMEPVVEVEPLVDLKITKSVNDTSPKIGDTLTRTLLIEMSVSLMVAMSSYRCFTERILLCDGVNIWCQQPR